MKKKFSTTIIVLFIAFALSLTACAGKKNKNYNTAASDIEKKKVETPVLEQTTVGFSSLTMWPDGSERTGRIKAPNEDMWAVIGKVLDKGPWAIVGWLGFDYLKSDSANDAATAQSRPPVVRPEVVSPEIIEIEPFVVEGSPSVEE